MSQPTSSGNRSTNDDDSDEMLLRELEEIERMDPKLIDNTTPVSATDEQIDDLLADLDLGDGLDDDNADDEIIEAIKEDIVEDEEIMDDASVRALEADLTVAEVMSERVGESATMDLDAKAPSAPAKKAREPRASTPRAERNIEALPETLFLLTEADASADIDRAANKHNVLARRPTQKKIADKFDNLFVSLNAGKLPSVYITACFKALVAKGSVTMSDLVTALTESKYTIGTARSQAGQVMTLFALLNVGTRTGNTLVFNEGSAIAKKLQALL